MADVDLRLKSFVPSNRYMAVAMENAHDLDDCHEELHSLKELLTEVYDEIEDYDEAEEVLGSDICEKVRKVLGLLSPVVHRTYMTVEILSDKPLSPSMDPKELVDALAAGVHLCRRYIMPSQEVRGKEAIIQLSQQLGNDGSFFSYLWE